jgi:hypothetical protein
MADHVALAFFVEAGLKVLEIHVAAAAEEFGQLEVPGVAMRLAGDIELDAVAGGEEDGLALAKAAAQSGERFTALLGREEEPFAQVERSGRVIQSQGYQSLHQPSPPAGHIQNRQHGRKY